MPSNNFDVDHIVELQVAGWPDAADGNTIQNMELLDERSNSSAGGATRYAVRDGVQEELQRQRAATAGGAAPAPVTPAEVTDILNTRPIVFRGVSGGVRGRRLESVSRYWTKTEIETGEHLRNAQPLRNVGEMGRAESFALVSPARTLILGEYAHTATQVNIQVSDRAQQTRVAGLKINEIRLGGGYANPATAPNNPVGEIQAEWNLPSGATPASALVTVPILKHSQYAGYLGNLPTSLSGEVPGASPVEFSGFQIEGDSVVAEGVLRPTIPLLGTTPLTSRLHGRELRLAYTYNAGELSLPIPGVSIDDSSISVFLGTDGFGAEGALDFSVRQLGGGRFTVGVTTERGFEASGRMQFDTELFDRAEIEVWYRERAFGGRGTLGIDTPNKVQGIRSAEITVAYDSGTFSAGGRVAPAIPGVQEAGLSVSYSETEGLLIGGTVALSDGIPGLRSGSVEAQVRRRPDAEGYEVSAHGTAQPAIPGVDTTLTIDYANGAFTAQATAAYSRGMLSGSLEVGATNRVISEEGQLTDEFGDALRAFGGGELTIQIAPWLQGTAGVRLLPNAEIEVQGEIGLPNQLEIFSRRQIERSIFNVAVQAPIFPSIVAEIGGGLSAQAGIGPGVIDQLSLGIIYNPSYEENTHVTGDAHLNIPADAGLRLAVRAGIGLGITGASATGGLEIGGMLGIGGAAEAGVHIDWTPSTGLRIDAVGELHAEPKFVFDIGGYVSVRVISFEVYGNRWQFASYEFGSNMRFGVRFPVDYIEGQPFDISLNDVEFIVPEIDTGELLRGLVDQIA